MPETTVIVPDVIDLGQGEAIGAWFGNS